MTPHRVKVRTAVEATAIHSLTAYSWFGKRSDQLPRSVRRSLTPETARSYLHYALQTLLYDAFYCAGEAQAWSRGQGSQSPNGRTPFIEALSAANAGSGYWTRGWTVAATAKDLALVCKNGVQLLAGPGEIEPSSPGDSPRQGTTLRVRFPKEFLHLSPGFYMAAGNRELLPDEESGIVRWYWNLTASGAIRFLRLVTLELNRLEFPFKLKVLNDPGRFVRCDAVVLYVRKRDCAGVFEALRQVHREVASTLKSSTPALTKLVAGGVGVAEDPGRGVSFGLQRCGLLAEGLIGAHEQGKHTLSERLDAVEERFVGAGVNLDQPYLNPGSEDIYRPIPLARRSVSHVSELSSTKADRESFLETADTIGRRLTAEAVWHRRRCTWLGAEPLPPDANQAGTRIVYRTLGPDLYAGSGGLALFLAHLHVATGDSDQRRTALGAIAQSFSNLDSVPPSVRFGFYVGWSGIAFAAARVGALLEKDEWIQRARRLFDRLARDAPHPREFDLMAGTAGAITALLALWSQLGEAALLEMAVRLGDELADAAEPAGAGCCWTSVGHPDNPGLTGFSHGASGIGHALIALFQATGEPRHRRAAEGAFQYERQWYDLGAMNWPDLRASQGLSARTGAPLTFSTAWCHGAPGVALARLRAYARLGEQRYKDEALAALATTARSVEAGLSSEAENYSLCHGMAGNADVLLQGCRMLGETHSGDAEPAQRVATLGIQRYARTGDAWPCGIPGETPGLMLGLAGIGYFYLRLADAGTPCILDP